MADCSPIANWTTRSLLTASSGERLAEARTGRERRHLVVGLLQQSVFGRLAGYEDVNDAERLCRDPAMRWVVGGGAPMGRAASASQMGRFETEWLTRPVNLAPAIRPRGARSPPSASGICERRRPGPHSRASSRRCIGSLPPPGLHRPGVIVGWPTFLPWRRS